MRNRYQQALDRVVLTPQSRARILAAVTQRMTAGVEKAARAIRLRRYGALAACLAVLLIGAVAVPKLIDGQNPVEVCSPLTEVESLEALEQAAGFPIAQPAELPFTVEETAYTYIDPGLAQIEYRGQGQTALWRQSLGQEDNSGDYTAYDAEETIARHGTGILLKGSDAGFVLAVWHDGTYSYSLSLSQPLDREGWLALIDAIS